MKQGTSKIYYLFFDGDNVEAELKNLIEFSTDRKIENWWFQTEGPTPSGFKIFHHKDLRTLIDKWNQTATEEEAVFILSDDINPYDTELSSKEKPVQYALLTKKFKHKIKVEFGWKEEEK